MPSLFRIHIRPSGGTDDMTATFRHCLDNGILGVGWRVAGLANTKDWDTYEQAADRVHESIQQSRYIYDNVGPGDLVWTRGPDARYFLAQVTSGWEYWTSREGRENNIDSFVKTPFHSPDTQGFPGILGVCQSVTTFSLMEGADVS